MTDAFEGYQPVKCSHEWLHKKEGPPLQTSHGDEYPTVVDVCVRCSAMRAVAYSPVLFQAQMARIRRSTLMWTLFAGTPGVAINAWVAWVNRDEPWQLMISLALVAMASFAVVFLGKRGWRRNKRMAEAPWLMIEGNPLEEKRDE